MLWSADVGRAESRVADDAVRALQSTERRLKRTRSRVAASERSSRKAKRELLSASTSGLTDEAPSPKGQTTSMRELVQIDTLTEHACGKPSIERWHVLEPVSGRWSWMRVFGCCNQVVFEPSEEKEQDVKKAA